MLHRAHLLLDQVEILQRRGQWAPALQLCDKVFRESVRVRALDDLLEVVLRSGFILGATGDREAAIDNFELAVVIATKCGDRGRTARALNGLGVAYQAVGEIELSGSYYRTALVEAIAAGDRLTRGDVEMNLGIIANIKGDLMDALGHYQVAYAEYDAVPNRSRLSKVLNNIGMVHIDLHQYELADEALVRGLNIARSVSDVATEGILNANRTELLLKIGNVDEARIACDQAFEIAGRLGDEALKADVLKYYGVLYRTTNKPHLAESHLLQSIELAKKAGNPLLLAEATRELSLVLREQDRNQDALQALNRAHALFSSMQARQDEDDIKQRLKQLEDDFLSIVTKWGESIEAKDRYTSGHCERVAEYACRLAIANGMVESDLRWFRMGAFLHDVGKTAVPEEILNKPGALTPEERTVMERHTIVGDAMISEIEFPWPIRPLVRSHHERWDGKGYPDGLIGDEIPYPARLLHIADVFDALTSTRSYRQPLSAIEAYELMVQDEGSYDPELLALFGQILPKLE